MPKRRRTKKSEKLIIKNFAHMWERRYISWGYGGVKGHLRGYKVQKKVVDFREQIGIYVLYDKDLNPVYVGQAGNGNARLFDRLKHHDNDHLWNRWEHFSWFGFRRINANLTLSKYDKISKRYAAGGGRLLNEIEGALITALEPKLNKQGASWRGVDQYYQSVADDEWEPNPAEVKKALDGLESPINETHKRLSKVEKQISRILKKL